MATKKTETKKATEARQEEQQKAATREVTLVIKEGDYQNLMKSNSRLSGSLCAITPDKLEFNGWSRRQNIAHQYKEYKTQYAKTRIYEDVVRITIVAERHSVNLTKIVSDESQNALKIVESL